MRDQELDVTIYTDGGADPNPGPGGWGAVLIAPDGAVKELFGSAPETTNNRMELTAAQEALSSLSDGSRVRVFTDSTYLRNGVTKWLPGWIRKGWKRKGGELKNVDLWQSLARLIKIHQVEWQWVKGHAGNEWNERADVLATKGIDAQRVATPAPVEEPVSVNVFVSVSCRGPKGAWAAIVRDDDDESKMGDFAYPTTAPRLEILSAATALASLPDATEVAVHSKSDYLRNGASEWIHGWKRGGWTTKAGKPVKNREAWQKLDVQLRRLKVRWPSIKGRKVPELKELDDAARDRLS